ncbi:MAG: single-stranded DNA-binding protein [Clostridia bacterium]
MNKVILMGRLTRDPEVRYTQTSNTLVASFSLAVNRRFVRQGEERQADFINIVAWNKTGEFVQKYFRKGQQVAVIGRLQTRTWDDDKGQKHYITEVIAEEAYFADSKRDGAAAGDFGSSFGTDATAPMGNDSEFEISSGDDLPF